MSFRVLFWNIEDFLGDEDRTRLVVDHIRQTDPDVLGLCEIRDKDGLRTIIRDHFPDFNFAVTDGQQEVELAVGWRREAFDQAIFTQKREFKARNPDLRPGALISLRHQGELHNVLFLHADSGRKMNDYGNRQDMFSRIWSLKKALNRVEDRDANLVVMGDMNTMGHDADGDLDAKHGTVEVKELDRAANKRGMNVLSKSHKNTFLQVHDGEMKFEADLDHVIVSQKLKLGDAGGGARVLVRGWVDRDQPEDRIAFVESISDHCSVEVVVI